MGGISLRIIWPAVSAALLLAFSPAFAETLDTAAGKRLSAEELPALFSDRAHRGTSDSGTTWAVEYKADGKMYGKVRDARDSGKWWLMGDRACREWASLGGGEKVCFTIVKDGETYKYFFGKKFRGHFKIID